MKLVVQHTDTISYIYDTSIYMFINRQVYMDIEAYNYNDLALNVVFVYRHCMLTSRLICSRTQSSASCTKEKGEKGINKHKNLFFS